MPQQLLELLPRRQQLHRVAEALVDGLRCVDYDAGQDLIGLLGLDPALQQDGVARPEAQAGYLHQGIGAGLEDHSDDADGDGYLVKHQALVQLGAGQQLAHHVLLLHEGVDGADRFLDLLLIIPQALDHDRRYLGRLGDLKVLPVGIHDRVHARLQRLGYPQQGLVPCPEVHA